MWNVSNEFETITSKLTNKITHLWWHRKTYNIHYGDLSKTSIGNSDWGFLLWKTNLFFVNSNLTGSFLFILACNRTQSGILFESTLYANFRFCLGSSEVIHSLESGKRQSKDICHTWLERTSQYFLFQEVKDCHTWECYLTT